MCRYGRTVTTGLALTAAAVLGSLGVAAAAGADSGAVKAVWVDHDIAFTYTGFTTHYSCSGLEDKVEYVLKQLGARPGFKVTRAGCTEATGPEPMPRVRIRAALPMEATPEVLAALEKSRATRELAAKAGGKPAGSADAAAAQFPATWRVVKFSGTPTSEVQDGDCELMEQLVDKVLKPMGAQPVEGSSLRCVPHQVSINAVNLRVRVLGAPAEALPAKGDEKR